MRKVEKRRKVCRISWPVLCPLTKNPKYLQCIPDLQCTLDHPTITHPIYIDLGKGFMFSKKKVIALFITTLCVQIFFLNPQEMAFKGLVFKCPFSLRYNYVYSAQRCKKHPSPFLLQSLISLFYPFNLRKAVIYAQGFAGNDFHSYPWPFNQRETHPNEFCI